jgi:Fe-S oxidoreductase
MMTGDGENMDVPIISEENLSTFRTCYRCRFCAFTENERRMVCPNYEKNRFFSHSAGGMVWIGLALLDGTIDYSKDVADVVYRCTTCGACTEQCVNYEYINNDKIDQIKIIEAIRSELFKRGIGPLKEHMALVNSLKNYDNPWMQPRSARKKWAKGLDIVDLGKEQAEVCYFTGCTASLDPDLQKIAVATAELLMMGEAKVGAFLNDELCCGSVSRRIGDVEAYERYASKNTEMLNSSGVKTVVTSCAGCLRTLKEEYPEQGELNFEVLHSTQYLDRLIKSGDIKPQKKVEMKVTYHDPCHLGRHCGIYEEPRNVLKAIPGIELVEMDLNREDAWCCGAGGGVRTAHPDFSRWTAEIRLEHVKETGADAIVSTCPFCEQNLKETVKHGGLDIPVYDVVELLKRSV